jgi:hypothetical protein
MLNAVLQLLVSRPHQLSGQCPSARFLSTFRDPVKLKNLSLHNELTSAAVRL